MIFTISVFTDYLLSRQLQSSKYSEQTASHIVRTFRKLALDVRRNQMSSDNNISLVTCFHLFSCHISFYNVIKIIFSCDPNLQYVLCWSYQKFEFWILFTTSKAVVIKERVSRCWVFIAVIPGTGPGLAFIMSRHMTDTDKIICQTYHPFYAQPGGFCWVVPPFSSTSGSSHALRIKMDSFLHKSLKYKTWIR